MPSSLYFYKKCLLLWWPQSRLSPVDPAMPFCPHHHPIPPCLLAENLGSLAFHTSLLHPQATILLAYSDPHPVSSRSHAAHSDGALPPCSLPPEPGEGAQGQRAVDSTVGEKKERVRCTEKEGQSSGTVIQEEDPLRPRAGSPASLNCEQLC